ncbi:MAG: hypothetical protein SFY66_12220 [Oculatellaceae cyanobacterium bins.114]|nr:hypothetical protein [Oculatellaceae cyanobacterium bins.114]
MKRQVLIATTVLLTLNGGFAAESIASSVPFSGNSTPITKVEEAASSLLKQNASRDRQRQQEAARREQERQRQAEMQDRWQNDRNDDDDDNDDRHNSDWWDNRNDQRWNDNEDYWDNRQSQQDRYQWEQQRNDPDWEQRQNSQYWENQRRDWENQRQDWEYRNNGRYNNWQSNASDLPYSNEGTRLELTSLSDEWVTVSIEGIDGEQELSFTGSNAQQSIYLSPGAYHLQFRPTLSSRPWRSGYLEVGQTSSIRVVFDQNRDFVQIYDEPSAWVSE